MNEKPRLSESIAQELLEIITIEKRFQPGDKLPNENELCEEFGVSRTTLREAIRSLVAYNVVEIRRGKGTYVADNNELRNDFGFSNLEHILLKAKDIFEMRLIIEPQAAYLAAQRATEPELEKILKYGYLAGNKVYLQDDYIEDEKLFHSSIAKATHNEFMMRVVPIINRGIWSGNRATKKDDELHEMSAENRKMLLRFFEKRDSDGVRAAMQLHVMLGAARMGLEF